MIPVQQINDLVISRLDAEGSDRYLFNQDIRPAINSAIDTIVMALNTAFGQKKVSEEALRDLVYTKVFQTNSFSRVAFNPTDIGHEVWTIIAIYLEPEIHPNKIPNQPQPAISVFYPNKSFVSSDFSAKRLTAEEANSNKRNPFYAGNNKLSQPGMKQYGYISFTNYTSSSYTLPALGASEVEIRPAYKNEFVGISYLKYPTKVVNISDNVEFPLSMLEYMVNLVAQRISMKQGDGTNLYTVSEREIAKITQFFS